MVKTTWAGTFTQYQQVTTYNECHSSGGSCFLPKQKSWFRSKSNDFEAKVMISKQKLWFRSNSNDFKAKVVEHPLGKYRPGQLVMDSGVETHI